MKIHKPKHLSIHANACLQALSESGLGEHISLGGAFGLSLYHEFRTTHDIDAWWDTEATTAQKNAVIAQVRQDLSRFGAVKIRTWGDVTSLELTIEDQVIFSFQIAARSVQLQPTLKSPWKSVRLDSFEDLVASKMTALVERGAPRDFLDIHRLCKKDLLDPERAWALWKRRVSLAGGDADPHRALLAVETHLQRIALHRPLDKIPGLRERRAAMTLRAWFAKEFLHALMD